MGVFTIPFLIFYIASSMYFPFISGKNFAFRIIIEIIFASWLILAVRNSEYRPKKTWIFWSVTAFILVSILATIFGEAPYRSFWSNYERMDGLISLLHVCAYFFVASSVLSKQVWYWFFHTTLGASIMMGVYILFQLNGTIQAHQGLSRVDGTFGNPTYLAVYALFHIFFALYYFLPIPSNGELRRKIWPSVFYLVAIILNTIGLYYTATRGAILGFIGGIVLMSLLFAFQGKGLLRKTGIGILILMVVVVIGFFAVKDTKFVSDSKVLSRFANISLKDDTTKTRLLIWGMGIEGFKEHPILGWGQENFNLVFNKYYKPELYAQEQWFDRSHNIFVDWLVQGGILGLLTYLSLFLAVLYVVWSKKNDFLIEEKIILTGLLAAYVFQNLFVFDNLYSYILFFSVLAYAHVRSNPISSTLPTKFFENRKVNDTVSYALSSVVVVALIFSVYFVNVKPIRAGSEIIQAIGPKEGTVDASITNFQKVISLNTFGSKEAREQLLNQSMSVARGQFPVDQKEKIIRYAKAEMDNEINRSVNDARGYLLMGSALRMFGATKEAVAYLTKAHELSPKKQTIAFELAVAYFDLKSYESARDLLKTAFESAPEFDTARILYATSLVYVGDKVESTRILSSRFGDSIPADPNLINAYVVVNDVPKVVELWEKKVRDEPNNPMNHMSLAAAYLKNQQRQKSIAEIRKAIELDPTFKVQGEQYIKDIQAGKNL